MRIQIVRSEFGAPLDDGTGIPILQWVELASVFQIPSFQIVGLAGQEVGEARERVRSAVEASGFEFPKRRLTLNLSPASIKKRGTGLDLAMALTVLRSTEDAGGEEVPRPRWIVWGELGLGGEIRGAGQLFRLAYCAVCAPDEIQGVIVSEEEAPEIGSRIRELAAVLRLAAGKRVPRVHGVRCLGDAWKVVTGAPLGEIQDEEPSQAVPGSHAGEAPRLLGLSRYLERVIGVAASGGHHLFLLGPKGTGKSHALRWLSEVIPGSSPETRVRRALLEELREGRCLFADTRWVGTASKAQALLGSFRGGVYRPGDFVLAHGGLLVADEWPEWHRDAREALREPLESGTVTLNRVGGAVRAPARFQLAATGNLCPCGGWPPEVPRPERVSATVGVSARASAPRCRCGVSQRQRYTERMSGPVLDRIDVFAPVIDFPSSGIDDPGSVAGLRAKVHRTSEILRERLGGCLPGQWPASEIEAWLQIRGVEPRAHAPEGFSPSLRSRHKIAAVAQTIAAWDGAPEATESHYREAACLRPEAIGFG